MARIRSIKPEFPQSESMGRVSRDARLCFIQIWTVADDSGRLRGNSRMLASLLFPYDDDAPGLIDDWLSELEREACIERYQVDGQNYIQVLNWLEHQKIDKPSASKLPAKKADSPTPREDSRILPVGEEGSGEERKGEEGMGCDNAFALSGDSGEAAIHIDRPAKPACPHKEIIALYHEILPMCPQIRDWTPKRQDQLRARWNEDRSRQNLDWWRRFFEYVATSLFLTGREHGKDKKPFFADLEWLTVQGNFVKVREGKYEQRAG